MPLEVVLRGQDSCDCKCLCVSSGRQWPKGSGYEQQRCRCWEDDTFYSDERASSGDRVQPCGNYQLPAALTLTLGPLLMGVQEFACLDVCSGCGNGLEGVGEAMHLFTATPYEDWKPTLCWGVQVGWGEEGRHGSSFSFPLLLTMLFPPMGSCYVAPCLLTLFNQDPLSLVEKPSERWKLKLPKPRRNAFLHHAARRAWHKPSYLKAYSRADWKLSKQNFSHLHHPLLQNSSVQQQQKNQT